MGEDWVRAYTDGSVGCVHINRSDKLNALNSRVMRSVVAHLRQFDADPKIRCLVIHGDERAFAAGADIDELMSQSAIDMYVQDLIRAWDQVREIRKPIVAAASGWVLGGGCELAMACDMIVASESARFGQPEIKIGVIPGAGGTQRLTRAIGKARAMAMILTGENLTAQEAFQCGLVSKVVPVEVYLEEAMRLARAIAAMPPVAVLAAKEAVLASFDTTIEMGLSYERKLFATLFASEDQREGMSAFLNKRKPEWKGR